MITTANPNSKTEMDDFSYDAVSWDADRARGAPWPRDAVRRYAEHGVSNARAVFALNSANVEGWGLYSEAMVKRYMPLEGQMGVLQLRMMRARRARSLIRC